MSQIVFFLDMTKMKLDYIKINTFMVQIVLLRKQKENTQNIKYLQITSVIMDLYPRMLRTLTTQYGKIVNPIKNR